MFHPGGVGSNARSNSIVSAAVRPMSQKAIASDFSPRTQDRRATPREFKTATTQINGIAHGSVLNNSGPASMPNRERTEWNSHRHSERIDRAAHERNNEGGEQDILQRQLPGEGGDGAGRRQQNQHRLRPPGLPEVGTPFAASTSAKAMASRASNGR